MKTATLHELRITTSVKAPKEKVWEVLTTPDQIRQWLFSTTVTTDWLEGSPIIFEGTWQGKVYHDKGKIIECTPHKTLRHSFWSSMSGKEDKPENYVLVSYELDDKGDTCDLTISQDGIRTEKEREHLEQNWKTVAQGIKTLAEEL